MRNLDSIFDDAERAPANPFREDVFATGISPVPGVAEIHHDALARCVKAFESLLAERGSSSAPWGASGRTLLIAAPRAGYGKSHLLGRVRSVTEGLVAPVALPFDPARPVAWETMLVSIFNQYRSSRCPQHPGCSLFEETVRYFQSQCVRQAIDHGVVEEKEIPETGSALRMQFREVFDPKAGSRMVAWLTKRSPEIMDAVAQPLGQRWSLEFDDLVFWNRFFQDAGRPKSTAFEQFRALGPAAARDRLTQFLRIASDSRPVAFLADHLDGFFGSETAGMRIAEILTDLRFSVPRSVTLLCLNEDVWNSIFEGKIPSAWIDRITGEATALRELSPEEAESLLRERLAGAGWLAPEIDSWLRHHRETCIDSGADGPYPRDVLRRASREWDRDPLTRTSASAPSPVLPKPLSPHEAAPEPVAAPPVPATPPAPEPHPLESVASLFADAAKARQGGSTPPNVFSAAEDAGPPLPKSMERPHLSEPTAPPPPPPPTPAARRNDARMDDPSVAARAAGVDPSKGLTNIEAIIAEIRGAGARSISEAKPAAPAAAPSDSQPLPATHRDPAPGADLDQRLPQIEAEMATTAASQGLPWEPRRLERLIRTVGRQYAAVAQAEEAIAGRPSLIWSVRGTPVRLGFEAPEHFSYWSEMVTRTLGGVSPGKLVLFSHPSAPFDFQALAAMGAEGKTATRHLDVIDLTPSDLALLYSSERLLDEAAGQNRMDQAIRLVAKRLDGFWRRLARPLSNAGAMD